MPGLTSADPAPPEGDLRALRTAAGLSLRDLAAHSGYSTSYLSRVENRKRAATPEVLRLYTTLAEAPPPQHRHIPDPRRPADGDAGLDLGIVWFGAEVRRLRMAHGKSLDALGSEVYLSRAYLGKIEQGGARGTYQLALALDTALGAGGRLARLFLEEHARVGPVPADIQILTRGAYPGPAAGEADHAESPDPAGGIDAADRADPADPADLTIHGRIDPAELAAAAADRLEHLRIRSHRAGPFAVLTDLSSGVADLHRRAAGYAPSAAAQLRAVALRYAEFLGWSAQETGHDDIALRWTRTARDWARQIGDHDAVGYALIRQSQWARRRGQAQAAVDYARAAAALAGTTPRIRQFAAQREAQAWALAGDESAFRRALGRFHELAGAVADPRRQDPDPNRPQWGPLPDPAYENSRVLEATCLVDLGDFHTAAALFAEHMSRLAPGRTGYARLAIREATAYAHLGDAELACAVAARSLPVVARLGSASLRGDLNRLSRTLNRHRRHPAVRDLLPDLAVLARAAGSAPVPAT